MFTAFYTDLKNTQSSGSIVNTSNTASALRAVRLEVLFFFSNLNLSPGQGKLYPARLAASSLMPLLKLLRRFLCIRPQHTGAKPGQAFTNFVFFVLDHFGVIMTPRNNTHAHPPHGERTSAGLRSKKPRQYVFFRCRQVSLLKIDFSAHRLGPYQWPPAFDSFSTDDFTHKSHTHTTFLRIPHTFFSFLLQG